MNCYITLDYELAMGDYTGTPERCLVEPMNHLTSMLDKYGIKLNIFVDAAYLLQMGKLKDKYPKLQKDYDLVTNHISRLDEEGHSIQLHLHPQWCYSSFDGGRWLLDKDHYKLQDMPLEEQKSLIHNGIGLLNTISSRKVKAFRAGGYCLENFSDLYDTFLSEGIIIDSSVVRGEHKEGKYHTYDYRGTPKKTPYRIYRDHKKEDLNGKMLEYRLSTIELPAVLYLLNKIKKNKDLEAINASKKIWGNGTGIGYPGSKLQILLTKLSMLFGNRSICAYIEVGKDIEQVYNYSVKHFPNDDVVMIGHPKVLSPFSIAALELFINKHPEVNFKVF